MTDNKKITERKWQHIELALRAQVAAEEVDSRFYYEPLFGTHPDQHFQKQFSFLGKSMRAPLWVSSMTGGTGSARHINQNLARATREFGLGMGLGSCRALLESDDFFEDFNLRPLVGEEAPFFANLGIAQLEELLQKKELNRLEDLLLRLKVDGLVIHLNPLQEWFQPEGDRYRRPAIETISEIVEGLDSKLVVKEVGQGMGPKSLEALLRLPLAAIEFGAFGGTNFSQLELMRCAKRPKSGQFELTRVGRTAEEMLHMVARISKNLGSDALVKEFIISGGVSGYLHGYYLTQTCHGTAVYGQAKALLEHAKESYASLHQFVQEELMGLAMAHSFLTLKPTQGESP